MTSSTGRPPVTEVTSEAELRRWYWLRVELVALARQLGVPSSGGKQELTERLAAQLAGRGLPLARVARPAPEPLPLPLSASTVLPPGQRCTQQLRRWFVTEVGPTFRFDGAMRAFLTDRTTSATLRDALDHWHGTRARSPAVDISRQFELNRFARRWSAEHPGGGRRELLAAWRRYKEQPVEERDRV